MDSHYRLHYAPDNASLIVRLALEEMGLPYRTVLVDRAVRAQRSPAYLRLNPNGLIPALETPDGPMFETGAILLWLADRHGVLAPKAGSAERAAFLKWLFFVSNTLHPAIRMTFYPDQYIGGEEPLQARLRLHMQGEIGRHLDKLEWLAGERPAWLAAETVSVLDFYVVCILRWLALYPKGETEWFDIGNWPRLRGLAARLDHCKAALAAVNAEGLGPDPFTAPKYANPPEGSAT